MKGWIEKLLRSLFFKIFLWFCLIVVLVGVTLELSTILNRYYEDHWATVLNGLMLAEAERAAQIFESSGKQALKDYLDELQSRHSVKFYFFDDEGHSLLDTGVPEQVQKMAMNSEARARAARGNQSFVAMKEGIAVRLVEGPSGKKYSLAFQTSASWILPLSEAINRHPYLRLLGIAVFGAVLCLLLTRNITRPIVGLRAAASSIAQGRLKTRVGPALVGRRDEIGALGRDFDRMAEQIESLVTAQKNLLGDVSHELRSPLARLIVALSLLRQCPREEAPEYLDRIGIEVDRLDKLIGQLLTLNRIDSAIDASLRVDFDLADLVHEVAADGDFEARAHDRSVKVIRADPCMMPGVAELLRSAIENVVRNAVRHTQAGTTVEITLRKKDGHLQTEGHSKGVAARLSVRDHGPGVPDNMLSEIFLPFHRVPGQANGEVDGAGLGLAIAERVVRRHEGLIRAFNEKDGGLVIEIDLPVGHKYL
ncbi:MAG: two-component system, OmpR family, sensor histidine kinase CpxA [Acidobacteriota bacterium]|nr:two-component system, OmpR family, sensor histidine kinase CpxA [Acidobacteriota bacterium]